MPSREQQALAIFLQGLGQTLGKQQASDRLLQRQEELLRERERVNTVSPSDLIRLQATSSGIPSQVPTTQASLLAAIQQAAVSPVAQASAARLTPEMLGFGRQGPMAPDGLLAAPRISPALQAPLGMQRSPIFQLAADLEREHPGVRIPQASAASVLYPTPVAPPGVGTLVESVSSELHGGRTYRQTTPAEQKATNAEVERRIQARYEQRVAAAEKVKPKPKASPAERTAIAESRAAGDALHNLRDLFDQSYVGPVVGRVGAIKDIFGWNAQTQSEFNAATAAFRNTVIQEITGAAMSQQEAERIMKQIPDVTNAPSVWAAKWNQSLKNLEDMRKRKLEVLRQSGVVVPENHGPAPGLTKRQVKQGQQLKDAFDARAQELADDQSLTQEERMDTLLGEFQD